MVLTALRTLPYRQRQVVVLRYYLDLSEGQIADQLGVTRGSVHRQLARAAGTLRTTLDDLKDRR
jgi:RNA polymerase sigma factor (sigma-70 family)